MESNVAVRLKRVAARQTVILTHYGRKSGKPYDVTIWFVGDGNKVYIGTSNVNRQWLRNVQKTSRIRLAVGSATFEATASFLTDRAEQCARWRRFGCPGRSLGLRLVCLQPW